MSAARRPDSGLRGRGVTAREGRLEHVVDPGSYEDSSTIDYSATSTYADLDLIDCNDAGGLSSSQVVNTTGSPQLIIDVTGFFAFF